MQYRGVYGIKKENVISHYSATPYKVNWCTCSYYNDCGR